MKRAISVLAGLAVLGLIIWAFLPRPIEVEVARIAPRTIEVSIEEEGEARIREVFTVSATIGGKLQRIGLHAGDPVVAGQTTVAMIGPAAPALLDARARAVAEAAMAAARSAVDLAQAQVAQAVAELEFSKAETSRSRTLHDKAAISTRLLDGAILAQKTAEATLDSARANLAVRERELDSAAAVLDRAETSRTDICCVRLIAPVSGQVLRVLTEDEQVVPVGAPILEVGNPQDLEVVVDLLSSEAVQVRKGAPALISGWGGPSINAHVEVIEPSATTKTSALGIDEQRVEVILALEGDPEQWRLLGHGFRVVVRVSRWKGENVLSIPIGALFRDGSSWATFVATAGRARLTTITLGERNDDLAQVLSGLKPGDEVILHPSDLVADGTAVAPMATD